MDYALCVYYIRQHRSISFGDAIAHTCRRRLDLGHHWLTSTAAATTAAREARHHTKCLDDRLMPGALKRGTGKFRTWNEGPLAKQELRSS